MNFVNAFSLSINDIISHCYFQRDYRLCVNTKLRNNSVLSTQNRKHIRKYFYWYNIWNSTEDIELLLATESEQEARLKYVKESRRQMDRDEENDMVRQGTHIEYRIAVPGARSDHLSRKRSQQ